jgi:hypothetical protein
MGGNATDWLIFIIWLMLRVSLSSQLIILSSAFCNIISKVTVSAIQCFWSVSFSSNFLHSQKPDLTTKDFFPNLKFWPGFDGLAPLLCLNKCFKERKKERKKERRKERKKERRQCSEMHILPLFLSVIQWNYYVTAHKERERERKKTYRYVDVLCWTQLNHWMENNF